jgi:3-hydroxy acid dehydrogenase / malonic semialdehyde reductase
MTTVLVTGASAGFGLATVERFVRDGARVIACARRLDRLQALAAKHPGLVHAHALDVTDRAAVAALPKSLPSEFAAVDVLVNNAGLALGLQPAQQADPDDWERMIATNCSGLVQMTRAFVPGMVERGRGSIINIGSTAGTNPYPGGNVYGATKAFVSQFTRNLNADLVGTGVRATSVEPGLVGGTEFSNVRFGDDARAAAVYAGTEPLTAEDIADTIHWLATRPPHMVIHNIVMTPNCQSYGPMVIKRKPA